MDCVSHAQNFENKLLSYDSTTMPVTRIIWLSSGLKNIITFSLRYAYLLVSFGYIECCHQFHNVKCKRKCWKLFLTPH